MQDMCNNQMITIIQGDTLQRYVIVEGAPNEIIENLYFTSEKLGISKELEYDEQSFKYELLIPASETVKFKPMITDFDITVKFFDEKVKTCLYKGKIKVLEKNNKIIEEE